MKHLFFLFIFFVSLCHSHADAQERFDLAKLENPQKYGSEVAALIETEETYEFKDTLSGTFFLKNGFRSSSFINGDQWLAIKDTVEVYRVDVVYSKYPLRKGVYQEIYPLLFNRLKNLFELDEELNRSDITWKKILQTHCVNDAQVDQLLHGVRIWYRPLVEEEEIEEPVVFEEALDEEQTSDAGQASPADFEKSLDYINNSSFFSDSLKDVLRGKTVDEQREILVQTLESELKNKPDQDLTKVDKIKKKQYVEELSTLIKLYHSDSVVFKVLSRHPEWQNVLVVNDWTGSMYGYGSHVIQWHVLNREISGIEQITLFNDGDLKPTSEKRLGMTGGIYIERADNIEKLIGLFQLVMTKGSGGDGPENDIEAILKTIAKADSVSEVVLIADNYACIRDIALADRINVPVRVIVCGHRKKSGINPDLVYLAKVTGGGLYTIEDDLENLNVSYNDRGEITKNIDLRFKVLKKPCESFDLSGSGKMRMTLKETRFHRKKVIRMLDLSKDGITDIHKRLCKLIYLEYLDLSNNSISKLEPEFGNLTLLRQLNLSDNKLTELPDEFEDIRYLVELNLANNQLTNLPVSFFSQSFLMKLDLSGNQLKTLPKVSDLKQLRELDLSNNQLKSLPTSFSGLKNLKSLNLSNNKMEVFPKALSRLKNLEELDFRDNLLKTIPPDITGMRKLKILHLEGNQFSLEEQERIRLQFPKTLIYF